LQHPRVVPNVLRMLTNRRSVEKAAVVRSDLQSSEAQYEAVMAFYRWIFLATTSMAQ
jgi:hypothetical protein